MPRLGEKIHLNLQLFDGQTGLFVIAHVLDEFGTELPGSPAILTHLSFGLYTNDSFNMPFTQEVKAVYKVYLDAGHIVGSPEHSDAIDVFPLEESDIGVDLIGTVEDSEISGTVEGMIDLGGSIFGDILLPGTIEQDVVLDGSVEEDQLANSVKDELTTGKVEC